MEWRSVGPDWRSIGGVYEGEFDNGVRKGYGR